MVIIAFRIEPLFVSVTETGGVFTFGRSRFADNVANKFWIRNDRVSQVACGDEHTALVAGLLGIQFLVLLERKKIVGRKSAWSRVSLQRRPWGCSEVGGGVAELDVGWVCLTACFSSLFPEAAEEWILMGQDWASWPPTTICYHTQSYPI